MSVWIQLCLRDLWLLSVVMTHNEPLICLVDVPRIVPDEGKTAGLMVFNPVLLFLMMEI